MSEEGQNPVADTSSPALEKPHPLLGEELLISSCKKEGARLVLERGSAGYALRTTFVCHDPKFGVIVRLWKAFTQHDITGLEPDAEGIVGVQSQWVVCDADCFSLNEQLADDCSDIRRLSTWPIERCFVYVDVSDFSQHLPRQQSLIIGSLISMVRDWRYWNSGFALSAWQGLEAMLCIGDGYIFVFKDAVCATYFAAYLAQLIETRVAHGLVPVEFHFRMGTQLGPVYCFWDWGRGGREGDGKVKEVEGKLERSEEGDWNYIGDGINGGQRVLAAVGKETDDVLFISGRIRQQLTTRIDNSLPARNILNNLLNRGRRSDKHNKSWRVYEVNHTALCGADLAVGALS